MSLIALQQAMHGALRGAEPVRDRHFAAAQTPGVRVYRNNYHGQLKDCLEQSFPRTREWIGDTAFSEAVDTHIATVVPSTWTIDAYSAGFVGTLHGLYPNDPEVAELAWLEWALGEAFVAADAPAVAADDLMDVDWDRAVLVLSPTLALRPAATNAGAIWSALADSATPPSAQSLPSGHGFLVWRLDLESRFRTTDDTEFAALTSVGDGASFSSLCAQSVTRFGDTDGLALAAELLVRWIADGLIAGISYPE